MSAWLLSASALLLVVLLLRALAGPRLTPRLRYALWLLPLLRLLLPISLWSWPSRAEGALPEIITELLPAVDVTPTVINQGASAAAASPTLPVAAAFNWAELLPWLWLAGSVLVALLLFGSSLRFYLRLRRSRYLLDGGGLLPVYLSECVGTACLFGLTRPAIYINPALADDEQALRCVIIHEQCHYRQGDHWWAALRGLATALHWWNPLVWLAASLSARDSELATDALSLRQLSDNQRLNYGRVLLQLAALPVRRCGWAVQMSSGNKQLKQRIRRIVNQPRTKPLLAVIIVLALGLAAVGCFGGPEQTEPQVSDNPPPVVEESTQSEEGAEDTAQDEAGQQNDIPASYTRYTDLWGGAKLAWPLDDGIGFITSHYGWKSRGFHSGTDIATDMGKTIYAVEAGTVEFTDESGGYGNLVIIDHGDGMQTYYAHCNEFLVGEGDTVERGQTIATTGMSGNVQGPHVHLELRINGETVDVEPVLENKGADKLDITE